LGSRLSAGERQRIALARAFLKNGSLIVLDEPTSHLDAQLNQTFISSLKKLMKDRMTVFIAHHLPMMKMADTVVMLQKGKIVETGTFQQLINQKGPFFEMVQAGLG
jgi:ABC-type multidrug transport system fused ATPase/permease subunit